jgi:hypothetical protein
MASNFFSLFSSLLTGNPYATRAPPSSSNIKKQNKPKSIGKRKEVRHETESDNTSNKRFR